MNTNPAKDANHNNQPDCKGYVVGFPVIDGTLMMRIGMIV
jgi:hypothetical protein